MYVIYPLRCFWEKIYACYLRFTEDVTSISWIFVIFACFIALIEVGRYTLDIGKMAYCIVHVFGCFMYAHERFWQPPRVNCSFSPFFVYFSVLEYLESWDEFSQICSVFINLPRIIGLVYSYPLILHGVYCFAKLHDLSLKKLKTPMELHD